MSEKRMACSYVIIQVSDKGDVSSSVEVRESGIDKLLEPAQQNNHKIQD
ncbi:MULTISPECIES: hypothetical protein [Pantoea]|nr:hypothetical protein [Pantoea ananatis]